MGFQQLFSHRTFVFQQWIADIIRECLDNLFGAVIFSETKDIELATIQSTHVDLFKNHIIWTMWIVCKSLLINL